MTPAHSHAQQAGALAPADAVRRVRVWDAAVRAFHWSLVAAMAYEFVFEAGTVAHIWLGYFTLALVAFRIVWGVVGTRHARFSDFVKGPVETGRYLLSVLRNRPRHYLGHNPAGAAMVLALLFMVTVTAATGWAMTADALWGEEWIEELHEAAANLTLVLIAAHVLGVIVASIQHRENLVRAMITGWKARP